MTYYDQPPASDGHGGPHPLAGVPQEALDAAEDALLAALVPAPHNTRVSEIDDEDVRPVAHAVLMAGLEAIRASQLPPSEKRCARETAHRWHDWETKKGKAKRCPGLRTHPDTMIGRGEKR